jgi:hypothetical protein
MGFNLHFPQSSKNPYRLMDQAALISTLDEKPVLGFHPK